MISIITATYNSRSFVDRLHASLFAQSNREFEWICVDDHSRDDTVEYLQTLQAPGRGGMQLYWLPHNSGGGVALAVGVSRARGDIILMVDHDDELMPDAVERVLAAWPVIADDPTVSALMFRISDPVTGEVIGGDLPEGRKFTMSWLANRHPDVHDATFVFKAADKKRLVTPELMEHVALGGWPLALMSNDKPFVAAPPTPIRRYHRDNAQSQTNDIKISRKTVTTYAGLLDLWDRWYWLRLPRWLRHAASLLRFSAEVHGSMWRAVGLVRRPLLKALLVMLMPAAAVLRRIRPRPKLLEFNAFDPGALAGLRNLRADESARE
jgi:glycosyltransferase involved in cell wall biosynthesis